MMSWVFNISNGVVKQVSGTRVTRGVYMGTEEWERAWLRGRKREAGMQTATVMLREWEDQVATGPWLVNPGGSGIPVCSNPQKLRTLPLEGMDYGADSTGQCIPDLRQAYALFGCTICLLFFFLIYFREREEGGRGRERETVSCCSTYSYNH